MAKSAAKKTGNFVVWALLVLLILGLGGFGISNFGGTVRSIGKVGDTDIPVDAYARALQQQLRAASQQTGMNITMEQALGFGLVDAARSQVISATAFDNELDRIGLSVSDQTIADQITRIDAFKGADGTFSRDSYRFALQQNGMTEAEFEDQLRRETARSMLQSAILSGVTPPVEYGKAMLTYIGARRSYELITFDAADLEAPVGLPGPDALAAYYDAHNADFTAPEARAITYVWLTPDMIADKVQIDEADLRALYDERHAEFNTPERRLVERLAFASQQAADDARARLDAGTATFEDLVAERGLTLADIDLGEVTRADLGAAGDAVFALEEPGTVGPIDSQFGPALFRMNAILTAQTTPFEDAQADLRTELAQSRARRMIVDMMTDLDDRLAAGATLEELADETELTLGTIDYVPGQEEGIAAYTAFREAASTVQSGDFPAIAELDDGGVFALRLDGVTPARLRPLDEVQDQAIAGWQAEETMRQLISAAEALQARLQAGEAAQSLEKPVDFVTAVTRDGITPQALSDAIFALEPGESTVVADGDMVYLAQLVETLPPDPEDITNDFLLKSVDSQTAQGIGQDLLTYTARALIDQAGLSLDQAAINAVHAQFP